MTQTREHSSPTFPVQGSPFFLTDITFPSLKCHMSVTCLHKKGITPIGPRSTWLRMKIHFLRQVSRRRGSAQRIKKKSETPAHFATSSKSEIYWDSNSVSAPGHYEENGHVKLEKLECFMGTYHKRFCEWHAPPHRLKISASRVVFAQDTQKKKKKKQFRRHVSAVFLLG